MPTFSANNEIDLSANPAGEADDRERMKDYWVKHSINANIQEMLLDTNAETLSDHELPEILALLPTIKGKRILELGAGIGRFTRVLAQQAEHVTAVDFIEKFVHKNQELNADLSNISHMQADATKLDFDKNSFHMIFSNWLLMYLNDKETLELVENSLRFLKEGGYLFFRESCFHQSGDIKKVETSENPTEYRSPTEYIDFFQSQVIENENECKYGFELVFARPNRTYIEFKNNGNQVCFLFQKVKLTSHHHGFRTMKEFLDFKQYSVNSILRYEKIYGEGYLSTGGSETTTEFLKMIDLKPNMRVLDVGCSIGGGDFLMSQLYGVEVFGLDLSSNAIGICWDRAQNYKNKQLKVRFEIGDVSKQDYPNGYFDVIYSRDSLLHIHNKKSIFNKFKSWLKPGGKIFFTDYICGPKPWSDEFTVYVEQRGYDLLTFNEYEAVLKDSEFVNIKVMDKTDMFAHYLKKELDDFVKIKDEFIAEFSMQDYRCLTDGWKEKISRTKDGYHKWGAFYAEKKQS